MLALFLTWHRLRYFPLSLPEPPAGAAAVFRDELNAGFFEGGADGVESALFQFFARFEPIDCVRGTFANSASSPFAERLRADG